MMQKLDPINNRGPKPTKSGQVDKATVFDYDRVKIETQYHFVRFITQQQ